MSIRAYPNLEASIAKRGVRKSAIAKRLGISTRALTNKLVGRTNFTWPEVEVIQGDFFPDLSKEELFATADKDSEQKN